jgi:hypothetical protein
MNASLEHVSAESRGHIIYHYAARVFSAEDVEIRQQSIITYLGDLQPRVVVELNPGSVGKTYLKFNFALQHPRLVLTEYTPSSWLCLILIQWPH